jgi:hypothetical protein
MAGEATGTTFRVAAGTFQEYVDSSKQLEYTMTGSGATPGTDWSQMDIVIRGYIDRRGQDE